MEKSDLKSGMIVELKKDGIDDLGLIIQTDLGLIIQYNEEWDSLNSYYDDLTNKDDNNNDIVSVRELEYNNEHYIIRSKLHCAKIIWERKNEFKDECRDECKKEAKIEQYDNETVIKIPKGVKFDFKLK